MEAMTEALYVRIQENERFAADVAHELKNPLTSIRSAVETSQAVQDPAVRDRLRDVIARDVVRLDRLISDISNLSRLEGEIVRNNVNTIRANTTPRMAGNFFSVDLGKARDAAAAKIATGNATSVVAR